MKLKLLGPPGTGKTTRLMEYLEKELREGTAPNRISFLTFTRAARIEALQRTGRNEKEFPFLKTIHAICYRQLAIGRDQIVRPENIREFGFRLGIKLTGNTLDPWIEEFDRGIDAPTRDDILLQANHCGRHRKLHLRDALEGISTDVDYKYAAWFTKAYRAWKESNGMMDYTDLLTQYINHGKPLPIDVMFVDESQDLSSLQWDVVNILGSNAQRHYYAGDDDQAIFHWAGADSTAFQDLVVDKVEVLSQSYRVSKAVYKAAMKVAHRIRKRLTKDYSPTDSIGEVTNAGFIGNIDLSSKAFILFRNHYRGSTIAQALRDENIPYIGRGSPLTDLNVRTALYAWHQLVNKGEAPCDNVKQLARFCDTDYLTGEAFSIIRERPSIKLAEYFIRIPKAVDWFRIMDKLPEKEAIASYVRKNGFVRTATPRVEVMSIHQSKGREAPTVFIDPEMSRQTWMSMVQNPDDEHRVWYVALTRAKERVFFLMPDGPYTYRF